MLYVGVIEDMFLLHYITHFHYINECELVPGISVILFVGY